MAKARKLDRISYDEMLELASLGAKVLHSRSVTCPVGSIDRVALAWVRDAPGVTAPDFELKSAPDPVASLFILVDTSASRALVHDAQVGLLSRLIEGLVQGGDVDASVVSRLLKDRLKD